MLLKSGQNVYQSIMAEYKKLITAGAILSGEKLPSCRELALQLGINPNTVERAYSELEAEGYIKILPKKGAYVDYVPPAENAEEEREGAGKGRSIKTDALKSALSAFKKSGGTREEALALAEEIFKAEG